MARALPLRFSLPLYVVPIVIGMSGVFFSNQFADPVGKGTILFLSVAVPLFFFGNVLARLHMSGLERLVVGIGVLMLLLGAVATMSGIAESLVEVQEVPSSIIQLSRYIGLGSVMLGLIAFIFTVLRSDEAVDQIGERFKQLTEQIGEGLIFATADGIVTMINPRLLRMTGLREIDFVGKPVGALPLPVDTTAMLPTGSSRESKGIREYELEWTRDGKPYFFSIGVSPLYNRYGRLSGGFATVRDISQQKKLSKRLESYAQTLEKLVEDRTELLRQSENQLRQLLLNMSEGFLTVDSGFTVEFANERILSILGIERDHLTGKSLLNFLDPSGKQALMDALEAAHSGHRSRMQQELAMLRSDGTSVPVVVAVSPIQEAAELAGRYSIVVTDVTELMRMQTQLEQRALELETANEELKLLDRAKDSLLANVSHELRTPLSTVRGYVEMLAADAPKLEPSQRNAIEVMERNVARLGQLIDEIISFSRMQIRGINLMYSIFDLNQLIQDCHNSAKPRMAARNVTLNYQFPREFQLIWGDRKNLEQVIGILISNAIKFSNDGGQIDVIPEINGSDIHISVRDHGIGIDPQFHRKVFDKFFQVDSSLSRRYEGVGIGLSIAKSIAEAHRGRMELHSEVGQGATFTIVLPNCAFDTGEQETEFDHLRGRDIIVVSENTAFAQTLGQMLASLGLQIRTSSHPFECARMALSSLPDLVLVDEVFQEKTMPSAIDKLQEHESTQNIPIVLMTNGDTYAPELAMCVNPIFSIKKPFALENLASTIKFALRADIFDAEAAKPVHPEWDMRPKRILVADPDRDLLDWLTMGLRLRKFDCQSTNDLRALDDLIHDFQPDIVLLDVDALQGRTLPVNFGPNTNTPAKSPLFYGLSAIPQSNSDISNFAGYVKKPFPLDELVAMLGDNCVASVHDAVNAP